jgi:hypothetical protein
MCNETQTLSEKLGLSQDALSQTQKRKFFDDLVR